MRGTKPPFDWQQGSLFNWVVSTPCIREEDASLSILLTLEGYLPVTPPFLVLQTMTQFHE